MASSLRAILVAGVPLAGAWLAVNPPHHVGSVPHASGAAAHGVLGDCLGSTVSDTGQSRRLPRRAILAAGGTALGLTALAAKSKSAQEPDPVTMKEGGAGPEIFDVGSAEDVEEVHFYALVLSKGSVRRNLHDHIAQDKLV